MSKVKHNKTKGVELTLSWQPASGGKETPANAVQADDGCTVVRARHNDEWVPGKLPAGHSAAYVAYGGKEHACEEYEVLVSTDMGCFAPGYEWVSATADDLPNGVVVAGIDNNEPLYIARGIIGGETCVGKVLPSHDCAYFPWGGNEHKLTEFEVLTVGH